MVCQAAESPSFCHPVGCQSCPQLKKKLAQVQYEISTQSGSRFRNSKSCCSTLARATSRKLEVWPHQAQRPVGRREECRIRVPAESMPSQSCSQKAPKDQSLCIGVVLQSLTNCLGEADAAGLLKRLATMTQGSIRKNPGRHKLCSHTL